MSIRNMMIGGAGARAPDAPTIGTATAGNASASVTFSAPANNGGSAITGFTVTSSPSGITGTGSSSPITVSGLSNGTAYTFTVTATNAIGTSPASAASNSVTPVQPFNVAFEPTSSFRSGAYGPTLGDMQTHYAGTQIASTLALWNSVQGYLMYDTPSTGTYRITVRGARGGRDLRAPTPQQYGRGQIIQGDVSLTAGQKVVVVCGAAPLHINVNSGDGNSGAPGGGASFVALTTSNTSTGALIPLIVSAGGAGGNSYSSNQALYDGQSYTNAGNWLALRPSGFTTEGGGRAGAGGGGAGWSANARRDDGGNSTNSGNPAKALNTQGLGGQVDGEDTSSGSRFGGFGGGAYAFSNDLSGGGGGYYGGFEHQGTSNYWAGSPPLNGDTSSPKGNATSYVDTALVSNYGDSSTYGFNDTYGSVTITKL